MGKKKVNDDEIANQKVNYCEWCSKQTRLGKTSQAETPILEFIEDKIDLIGREDVWGEDGDWSRVNIDSEFEAELLIYDSMLVNISPRIVCTSCLIQDDLMFKKYYGEETKEGKDDSDDDDDHYIIELE